MKKDVFTLLGGFLTALLFFFFEQSVYHLIGLPQKVSMHL